MRFGQERLCRPLVIIALMGVGALAFSLPNPVTGDSASALDGLGSNISCQARGCIAQSITTTQTNDVIIVTLGPANNVSLLTDSSGLTFNQRLSYAQSTYNESILEYYAVAPAPLSSDNITVVGCSCPRDGIQVIAIHGADLGSIFDQDPSVPATVSCTFDGTYYSGPSCGHCLADYNTLPGPCSAAVETSTVDFVIATTVIADAGPCRGGNSSSPAANQPPIGFTNTNAKAGNFEVDYTQTTTPETTVSFNCYGTDATAIVLDAIALGDSSTIYGLTWQGYDWDGAGEENVTLNGQLIASLPATDSPQNGGAWATFSIYSSVIVQGTNTLAFTHANWDCGISDNVQNLQITSGSSVVYSNSTFLPLDCTQSLTYTFTV